MSLVQLVYSSVALHPFSDDELFELLRKSRSANEKNGLTGVLLYSRKSREFHQLLEGEATAVQQTLAKITQAPRHTGIDVMYRGDASERSYGTWSMAFEPIDELDTAIAHEVSRALQTEAPNDELAAKKAKRIHRLMERLRSGIADEVDALAG